MRRSRHNVSRKHKLTRKQKMQKKGGMMDDHGGYTLVGFLSKYLWMINPLIPIILHNNVKYNEDDRSYLNTLLARIKPLSGPGNGTEFEYSHIMLPELYKLKKFRGVDIWKILTANGSFSSNVYFYDDDEKLLFSNKDLIKTSEFKPSIKPIIKEMELKYPGLFQRIFVTEEEERQALEEIQKKENTHNNNENNLIQIEMKLQDSLQKIQRETEKSLSEIQKKKETNNNFENLRKVISQIQKPPTL